VTTSRDVRTTVPKGQPVTLAVLKEFITELDRAGAVNTTPIDGEVTWGGHLKSLSATAIRFGDSTHPGKPS
jgi:hypothetical protein